MRKYIYIFFFIIFFVVFFSFLSYRIFVEKIPRNVLIFTGIFLMFFVGRKTFFFFLLKIINFYKKLKELNLEEKKEKVTFVKNISEKFDSFIEKDLLSNFVFKHEIFSRGSLFCYKFYENHFQIFYKITFSFLLIPWCIIFFVYFLEIFSSTNLYYALFLFPINLLIKKVFDFFMFLVTYEAKRILDRLYELHFPIFFHKHHCLREFFLVNGLIRRQFFFHEPLFQNKKDLVYFWDLVNQLIYQNILYRSLVDFNKPAIRHLKKVIYHLNAIVFFYTFLIFLADGFFVNSFSFFAALLTLFSFFLLLLTIISYFHDFSNEKLNTDYTNFFQNLPNLTEFYYDDLVEIKKDLLKRSFLTASDLKFNKNFLLKSVKNLHFERNNPLEIAISLEKFEISLKLQKKTSIWFFETYDDNRIRMYSFDCVFDEYEKKKYNV